MNDKAIGQLSGLAGRLVAESLLSAQQAIDAQKEAALERMHFVQFLVEKKNINGRRVAEVASQEFGVPLFDIEAFNTERWLRQLQRFRELHHQHILHFGETGETNRSMGRLGTLYGLRSDGSEFPIEASIDEEVR